jgi:multidrug efflux pump subunit AcrB
MFPPIELNKIIITGGYSSASIDSLDKIVVNDLENEIKNIAGIKKIESFIQNGKFKTILTLKQSASKDDILDKVKNNIDILKKNYPSDMNDPIASIGVFSFPLLQVSLSSSTQEKSYLRNIAKKIKKDLLKIPNISGVDIYDDSSFEYKFILDYKRIQALGIDKNSLISSLQSISITSPIGTISNSQNSFFISTQNGKSDIQDILNTMIKVQDKFIYIKDIAQIKYEHKDSKILTFLNANTSINLSIKRDKLGDSLVLEKKIQNIINNYDTKYKDLQLSKFLNTTVFLKNRLNVVISNLIFSILLVGFLIWWLINARTAIVVSIGILFSFLIGAMFLYFAGYSINMMTLLGSLIILGVVVDDAIIVGENIQRNLNINPNKILAIQTAIKEVLAPVIVASFTTIFAFLPLLLMSGEMGEFMKLIPVAIVVLILASLIESFLFLPLHSKHILKTNAKELNWEKAINIYQNILNKAIKHKKKFLFGFYILIPLATIYLFSISKYVLFPQFDGSNVYIRGAFDANHTLIDTKNDIQIIQNQLLKIKNDLGIKSILSMAGSRLDNKGQSESKENVFDITLELNTLEPQNFFERYITPMMSIYHFDSTSIRTKDSHQIVSILNDKFKNIKQTLHLDEFSISTDHAGITKHNIEMQIYGADDKILKKHIDKLKDQLTQIKGVLLVDDNLQQGLIDLKLYINKYGESLGISERYLSSSLSSFFRDNEFAHSLNNDGLINMVSRDINKDNINTLREFNILLPNNKEIVLLKDIVDFVYIQNYKEVYKVNNQAIKYLFADIDNTIITADEVLKQIQPYINKLEKDNITIKLKGEREQNEQIKQEMSIAFALALFLILSILLIMFNSYKYALVILSIIPLSILGALLGHIIMNQPLSVSSFIGIVGLSGVVVNDGIVMLSFLRKCINTQEIITQATLRLRPVFITSITTFIGLGTLIFFATGQAKILQPIAVSLGFGMIWGTILTLFYAPIMTALLHHISNPLEKNDTM